MAELKKSSIARRFYGRANGRSRVSMNRLKILVTVVFGHGTAPREIATEMGRADSERAVIFSVIGENNLRAALDSLGEKFNTIAGGKGIAYTIPMSSIIGKSIFNFLSDNRDAVRRNEA